MDIDERRRHWEYLLAGGDPEKFHFDSPDRAGTGKRNIWDKIKSKLGHRAHIGDVANLSHLEGFREVSKITEQMPDGSTRTRFVDADGNEVQLEKGEGFMKSKRLGQG